jgi:hypothetical protein
MDRFEYVGNVTVGKDVSISNLLKYYNYIGIFSSLKFKFWLMVPTLKKLLESKEKKT